MKIENLREVKGTNLESFLLAHTPTFWQLLDQAHAEGERKGFTKLEDLPD